MLHFKRDLRIGSSIPGTGILGSHSRGLEADVARTMLKFMKALLCNQVLIGSFFILAFCAALALLMAVLSWLNYRDQYGISLADFFKLVF